ncbi:hypothetical protein [Streptomyces sp. KHY 26]|uniref:hypothetical protein n=1 Tax=Streptomyces sp. KHY 26 TaxID=3097359 RepID=UPI00376ECE10
MPGTTAFDQATSMIEKAWAQPIEVLKALSTRQPCADPLLRSALHTRATLAVTDEAAAAHKGLLQTLTRPGYVPAHYELDRIVSLAAGYRVARAESGAHLQAIRRLVEAREASSTADRGPAASLSRAAIARSGLAPHAPGRLPDQPVPAAAVGPSAPASGPRR